MKVKNEISNLEEIDFRIPIKKKQEVIYTTFKLSQTAHEAIKEVAQLQGLNHAEVFDSMLLLFNAIDESSNPLQFGATKEKVVTTRKTYVLKKETLDKLRRVVKPRKINRDVFVERIALLLKRLVDKQISEKKKIYPQILKDYINPFEKQANDIEKNLIGKIGDDDPITRRFSYIVTSLMNLTMAIDGNIKKDIPIDPDDISQQ